MAGFLLIRSSRDRAHRAAEEFTDDAAVHRGLVAEGLMLRDPEIWARCDRGSTAGSQGLLARGRLVQAACELAVREYWGGDYDVRDILK